MTPGTSTSRNAAASLAAPGFATLLALANYTAHSTTLPETAADLGAGATGHVWILGGIGLGLAALLLARPASAWSDTPIPRSERRDRTAETSGPRYSRRLTLGLRDARNQGEGGDRGSLRMCRSRDHLPGARRLSHRNAQGGRSAGSLVEPDDAFESPARPTTGGGI
jgi:hypothetical protein